VEGEERAAVDLERHLRELLLRELVAGDRLVEDDPLLRVVERRLEHARAAPIEPQTMPYAPRSGRRVGRAATRSREAVLLGHAHVFEDELRT
jgi:hypothetical protein